MIIGSILIELSSNNLSMFWIGFHLIHIELNSISLIKPILKIQIVSYKFFFILKELFIKKKKSFYLIYYGDSNL